jgi:hypothetical protein
VHSEAPEKRFERLHLKPEQGIELPIAEATEGPLSTFKLDCELSQGCGEGCQYLARISIADALLGQSCQAEDPISESLRRNRNNPQPSTAVREIIHDFGCDPQLFPRPARVNRAATFDILGRSLRAGLPLTFLHSQCFDQSTETVSVDLQLSSCRPYIAFEQILRFVARSRDLMQAHHSAGALECMQLPAQSGRRVLVLFQPRYELLDPVDAFASLFKKEREEFRIAQILVQFKRLTSTPRVPIISLSEFLTATAIVKQGSPVKSES